MAEKRVQFQNVVENQLPTYVQTEFPLVSEFLKSYYISQEFQGAPADLIQNIDKYVKVDNLTNLTDHVGLGSDIIFSDTTIPVDLSNYPSGTSGFPETYGLLKIDDEIVTYTGLTTSGFTGCVRGFSGITTYKSADSPDQLVFDSTISADHEKGATITNLSCIFLKDFLLKTKHQLLPGFENRKLHKDLNKNVFIKQSKDFYRSKGTDLSFQILFKALYNEEVSVIKPRDFLFTPSNAHYIITNDFVVEGVEGDPMELENSTLFQDPYGDPSFIEKAYAPITNVEQINVGLAKTFYKLSLDAGYNRDSRVEGATYGTFITHPKTRMIGQVSAGTTIFDVDSTVGFPNTGELSVRYNDTKLGIVSYTSKNLNQFFGCSNVIGIIEDAEDVGINTYCYAQSNTGDGSIIRVRVGSVLESLNYANTNRYYSHSDVAKIKTLGIKEKSFKGRNWFYNIATQYNVKSVELIDISDQTYLVYLKTEHSFRVGDNVILIGRDTLERPMSTISEIKSATSFIIKGQGNLATIDTYTVKRVLLRSISNTFPDSSRFLTNVQNLYKQGSDYLIASPSIPSYNAQPLNVSSRSVALNGTFPATSAFTITSTLDHGFYTGDAVWYTPQKEAETYYDSFGKIQTRIVTYSFLFEEGLYFIKRLDAYTIRLAKSIADIANGVFVVTDNEITVENNKIEPYTFKLKTLESQKIVRSLQTPIQDSEIFETVPGPTGILINGVEVQNYKSKQLVNSGKIENIEILAEGNDYDIIDPPLLYIDDVTGIGATGFVDVQGSLQEIRVKSPGSDYTRMPSVTITGGNGTGAVAQPNMGYIQYEASFSAQNVNLIGIGATVSTIGFSTYHKLRPEEPVVYYSEGQDGIVGLNTYNKYFIGVVDNFTVQLYPTQGDSILGINTVVITDYGVGNQILKPVHERMVLSSVNVIDEGSGYTYRQRSLYPVGVNTSNNVITIEDHGYNSGETVRYSLGDGATEMSGISSATDYILTKIDDDNFKLSNVGIATIDYDIYYQSSQFINIESTGIGTQFFNYPPIEVNVLGEIGISSIVGYGTTATGDQPADGVNFACEIQPIFRGRVTGVHLSDNGVGYGNSTVMDYVRQPSINLSFGEEAQLKPVVIDGRVSEIIVENPGHGYNSPPDVIVEERAGYGFGCVATPILAEDGRIESIKVLQGGEGYTQQNVISFLDFPGGGAEFKAQLQKWRVNLVGKHWEKFTLDDGFIVDGRIGLQYTHLYAPRILRESVYSTDQDGNTLYGQNDLSKQNGSEISATGHSPIIGWAYDGNPIYGPYGYATRRGGVIKQMKSGYKLDLKSNRPSEVFFPEGFFIEDYTYTEVNDETVLDKNNGRFCITPEFPNGTYAYFATVDAVTASAGPFLEYREPKFPYLVGDAYHSVPNKFNFDLHSNQDDFNLSAENWFRNTEPYNLIEDDITYKYAYIPNKLKQKVDILSTTRGTVQDVGISSAGKMYKMGDEVIFDNSDTAAVRRGSRLTNTNGILQMEHDPNSGAKASISLLEGDVVTNVSVATSTISGVEFYPTEKVNGDWIGWCENPHNFLANDIISVSGLSTTSSDIEGSYKVGITTNLLKLVGVGTSNPTGLGSTSVTGIVTFLNVGGVLEYPNIRENDILGIGTERVKVLNVDKQLSRIRVIRAWDNTVGVSHSIGTTLYDDPRKIIINAGFRTTTENKLNEQRYFNPVHHVGVGTSVATGIGSTVYFENVGLSSLGIAGVGRTGVFIPTRTMWIENHMYQNNDVLTYSPGNGSGIVAAGTTVDVQGSVLFDGTGDYMTSTDSAYELGNSNNFTVEAWIYPQNAIIGQIFNSSVGSASNIGLTLNSTNHGDIRLLVENDAGTDLLDITTAAGMCPVGQWTHVAASLYNTAGKIFINGVVEATGTLSGTRTGTGTVVHIGAHKTSASQDRYFRGKISNLRYAVGEAIYTAAFTPPVLPTTKTSQAAAGSNVKLLCCKSQVSAAATGVVGAALSVFGDTRSNGGSPAFQNWAGTGTTLTNGETLYAARISKDELGIATCKVFINEAGSWCGIASTHRNSSSILFFTGIGTGTYHSFNNNFTPITGKLSRNLVTVGTAGTHGLQPKDTVIVRVNPSNAGIVTVKYNDYNRKLTLDAVGFTTAGVTTSTNTFTINDNGFTKAEKVVHIADRSDHSTYGLEDQGIYYVVPIDDNQFKLSSSYYNATRHKPIVVSIGNSASSGTLNPINPPITVYKDSVITFDLSDSSLAYTVGSISYPAFDFQLYADNNCVKEWNKNPSTKEFQVKKSGRIGIDTDAKLELTIDKYVPDTLYYRLLPVYESDLPEVKSEIDIDGDVLNGHEINSYLSVYNGKHIIGVGATNTYTYTLASTPEKVSYAGTTSDLTYKTDSETAFGPIAEFNVTDGGNNYYSIPGVKSITSELGQFAIAEATSNNIGKITKTEVENIGYNFPSDPTLEPSVALPQIVSIKEFARVQSIGITSVGRGYSSPPNLRLFDGKTDQLKDEFAAKYDLKTQKVEVLRNTFGIHNVTPYIIPTENTNGVGIATVGFNTVTKDVTLTLAVGFTTAGSFPFQLGDRVLVENVSVGVGSTGTGYNSASYNYNTFPLIAVDENIGGIGTVAYSLKDHLSDGETPGVFHAPSSAGRVIAEKNWPVFNIAIEQTDYLEGEIVKVDDGTLNGKSGIVDRWDKKVGLLKVSTIDELKKGDVLIGQASHVHGRADRVETYAADLNFGAWAKVFHGWETDSGVLNYPLQKIEDSFYYQNFSYSLKSKVDYDTWKDPVGTLNHTSGFKKFSDYQLESTTGESMMSVGLSTETTSVDAVNDIIGIGNMNAVSDFDLVRENYRKVGGGAQGEGGSILSDEVIFANRVLSDYEDSQTNRVLTIDDFSGTFNSNPRPTIYGIIDTFTLTEHRAKKYFTLIKDQRYTGQRQLMIVDLIHDGTFGYINQYAKIDNVYDLGSFDFQVSGTEGQVLFYPTRYKKNDYYVTTLAYNLDDNYLGIGTTSLGCVYIDSTSTKVAAATTTTVVGIATTYRSAKVLVSITPDAGGDGSTINSEDWEFEELNILHDGTNVDLLEYGEMVTSSANLAQGFGTYSAYIESGTVKIDFHPNAGIGTTCIVNTMQVAIGNTTTGIGTISMKHALLESRTTTIAAAGSPIPVGIGSFPTQFNPEVDGYDGAYFIVQVTDTTNTEHQLSEFFVLEDYSEESGIGTAYDTEWANIETLAGLGTIGSRLQKNQGGVSYCEATFTPNANIDCQVNTYMNALKIQDDDKDTIDFNNGTIETDYATYRGTLNDIKRDFPLTHNKEEIFNRDFVGNASTVVSVGSSTITLPNHFFVTGQNVNYTHSGIGATQAIGIGSTSFGESGGVGIGTTDKTPSSVYVIKVDDDTIRLASSAENALKVIPESLNFTSVGIGSSHRFTAKDANAKVVIGLDNVIQSPVVATATTTHLSNITFTTDDLLYFSGITSFFADDLVRVGAADTGEIMQITAIGVGATNAIRVDRGWMGSKIAGFATDTKVVKVIGAYNIVENTLNFVDAPVGNTPLSTDTNKPDDRDWVGISTGYSFQGRMFMRSGITDGTLEPYTSNYIIDSISNEFNGLNKNFDLKVDGANFVGISTGAFILINSVVQGRGETYNYTFDDTAGITTLSFVGNAKILKDDVGISSFPVGGIIISVGSTEGFGYQPLVSAGGTAIVSGLGTISSISIGNSGSGYRAGIQTVNVGISSQGKDATYFTGIATAIINNGYITGISSVSGIGTLGIHTSSNPPLITIDAPLSYSGMPLIYSSDSVTGVGTTATIDVVVGQGSSVVDFALTNLGFGYGNSEILTVPVGGLTGIPTTADFGSKEFQLTVDEIFSDEFTGWSFGELDMIDKIEDLFDGETLTFQIKKNGAVLSILSAKGSKINVQDCLLIFVNDILQIPGKAYKFEGGSLLTFTEAPKFGDSCKIMFYKGTAGVDVNSVEILETVKPGDDIMIEADSTISWKAGLNQQAWMDEDEREVARVDSTDTVTTVPYFGPGNTTDENLMRPVIWVRQTEDRIINDKEVAKDRELYEPNIYPAAYLIKTVGVGSTAIYVDNIRPFFDPNNESGISLSFQDKISFVGQESKIAAAATATVSTGGTISAITVTDGGVGYTTATVSIGATGSGQGGVGIGTTWTAYGAVTIAADGTISGIAVTSGGYGYSPEETPQVLISPPASVDEVDIVSSYVGDSGVIVGFGTTTSNQIMFDLHIPYDSYLRQPTYVGTGLSLSSLSVNDYFIIENSNVGIATTSITSLDGSSTYGIGTHFADNVYKVTTAVSISTSVLGISTYVRRVTVGVGSTPAGWYGTVGIRTSDFYGNYSWGVITLPSRAGINSFQSYTLDGVGVAASSITEVVGSSIGVTTAISATGIHTSAIVQRYKPLKYKNYTT